MDIPLDTTVNIESYTFGDATGIELRPTAKRYTSTGSDADDALTLIFAHCLGSREQYYELLNVTDSQGDMRKDKEQWEPTIEQIFRLQQHKNQNRIREVWAFDWQSHGESAIINEKLLNSRTSAVCE